MIHFVAKNATSFSSKSFRMYAIFVDKFTINHFDHKLQPAI